MSKNSEDGLESFFRRAAGQSDNSHLDDDWKAMEEMLDDRFGVPGPSGKITVRAVAGVAFVVAVVATVGWLTFSGQDVPEPVEGGAGTEHLTTDADERGVLEREAPPDAYRADDAGKLNESRISESTRSHVSHGSRADEETLYAVAVSNPVPDVSNTAPAQPADVVNEEEFTDITPEVVTGTSAEMEPESTEAQTIAGEVLVECNGDSTGEAHRNELTLRAPRWSVSLMVAPDFSTTAPSRYNAPGKAIGFTFGYRVNDRFAVTLGLIKSAKRYRGMGAEYNPPEGYWERRTNGIVPKYIDGRCSIVEVPLAVQYNLRTTPSSRLFLSGGVSSYLMLDESYDYTYETPNPGADQGWASDVDSRYVLAVTGLSVGYERNLSGNVTFGVEPFIKVPLAPIGWNDVKLFTAGAYFNIRYWLGTSSVK